MISNTSSHKLITVICMTLALCNLPIWSFAQSKGEKAAKPPKMKSSIFGRDVLYPEKIIVRPDGAPVYGIEAEKMALSVMAIHGTDVIYFQVDILNESEQPFNFYALDFRLYNDQGFRVQGLAPDSVVAMLASELNMPPPSPPPPPQVSRTTVQSTTTGRVDPYGNVTANTTSTGTTTTAPDPAYQAGSALGAGLGALFSRGARNREKAFIEELAAYGYVEATVMPNERQRF
jgi:hypothetical protein